MRPFLKQQYVTATRVTIVTLSVLFLSNSLLAAQKYIRPSVSAGLSYNDNIRLSSTNKDSEFSFNLRPSVAFGVKSEVSSITLNLVGDSRRYAGGSNNDSNDISLNLSANKRTERASFGLGVNFSRRSALTAEQDDSGLLVPDTESDRLSISPSFTYTLSQRQSISLGYSKDKIDYNSGAGSLVGYSNQAFNGSYNFQSSAKNSYSISLSSSEYETEDSLTETESINLSVGIQHKFTETLSGSANIGSRDTDSTTSGVKSNNKGTTYSFGLTKKLTKTVYQANMSRALSPSSAGVVNESDRFSLSLNHKLSKKMQLGLNLSFIKNRSTLETLNSTDREFKKLSPSLMWQLSEKMNVSFIYEYSTQKFESAGDDANANVFRVNFQYSWNPTDVLQ